jgi:hypothetical protein
MLSNFTLLNGSEPNSLVTQLPSIEHTQLTAEPINTTQYWMGASGVILSIAVLLRVLLPVMLRRK